MEEEGMVEGMRGEEGWGGGGGKIDYNEDRSVQF